MPRRGEMAPAPPSTESQVYIPQEGAEDFSKQTPRDGENLPFGEQSPETLEHADVAPGAEAFADAQKVKNNETLATDAEILGRHYPIRQLIGKVGDGYRHALDQARADWANLKDTPGLATRKLSFMLAERSLNRRQAKLDEVAHLPDEHPLKMRRQKKLNRAKRRYSTRKRAYEYRANRMQARDENVAAAHEQRRSETRAQLAEKRKVAEAHKAVRQKLREQGADWRERRALAREIITNMPKNEISRIAQLAVAETKAKKDLEGANQKIVEAQQRVEATNEKIKSTESQLNSAREQMAELNAKDDEIKKVVNDTQDLREAVLKARKRADQTSEDSPNRFVVMHELVEAENALEEATRTISEYRQAKIDVLSKINRAERELDNLRVEAERAERAWSLSQASGSRTDSRYERVSSAKRDQLNESLMN